ncbi:MAG: hypothetical protein NPINA01_07400 [Nitrospinaceae bacterium]|nr:MAG: hypothetical protein NPINA01_07400 [Nitrospinaceae bacterium]
MKRPTLQALSIFVFTLFVCGHPVLVPTAEGQSADDIPAKVATDYIHSVIVASREFYSKQIVGRLNKAISLKTSENWEKENALPLPAQFLKLSAQHSNDLGIGLKIRLVSLTPINTRNLPRSDLETLGLRSLTNDTKKPFTWVEKKRGRWNFKALYPDTATAESCFQCHNAHPKSPKKDFKMGSVLGGILINIPLSHVPLNEQGISTENDVFAVPSPIVSDYLHAVLESDRFVYTKFIVKRMKTLNKVETKEAWADENALPLPAQYLLNTGLLARKNKAGLNLRLISLWPISFNNSAANEFERNALVAVNIDPLRPYMGKLKRGRSTYFQAVYPDFAVSKACVDCHNAHPKSPKRDFQLDDLMGGMIVSFPLNKN